MYQTNKTMLNVDWDENLTDYRHKGIYQSVLDAYNFEMYRR